MQVSSDFNFIAHFNRITPQLLCVKVSTCTDDFFHCKNHAKQTKSMQTIFRICITQTF